MGFRRVVEGLSKIKRLEASIALVFGIFFAISLHAYFLIDHLPLTGKRLPGLTLLAFLVGAVIFYFLLRLLRQRFKIVSPKRFILLVVLSLLISGFLFYTSSNALSDEFRYPTLFLPSNTVKIEVPASQTKMTIKWLSTSLGELSYNGAQLHGWQREGDELVLVDPVNNSIEWQGKTGNQLKIVFQKPEQESTVRLTINHVVEDVLLKNSGESETTIVRELAVPFYASRSAAKISLWLSLAALFFVLLVFLAGSEREIVQAFQRSTPQIPFSPDQNARPVLLRFENWEWVAILVVVTAALLLRIFHLDYLFPYTDEYSHLNAAKNIINGMPPSAVYQRSLYIVTLPVVLFFKLLGMSIWAARIPGVIFNSLAIVPLYLLSRKINRPTALLAIGLYATNPWIIAVARTVREYGYYPFYIFWILYAMLIVMENLPRRIVIDRQFLQHIKTNWLVPLLLLTLPLFYTLKVDRESTFKVFLLAYGIFALFLLARFDFKARSNLLPMAGMAAVLVLVGFTYVSRQNFVSFQQDVFTIPFQLFFPNPQQQWYYNRSNLLPLLAFCFAVIAAVWQYRYNPAPLFLVCLFTVFLAFFTVLFSRYYRPRYLFSVQIFYIPVLAFGLSVLWLLLRTFVVRKSFQIGAVCLALVTCFNPQQSLLPSTYNLGGAMPVTTEYHYDFGPVDNFLHQNAKPTDVLVTTIYINYVRFMGQPKFQYTSWFYFDNPKAMELFQGVMEKYRTGWLVMDLHRYMDWAQQIPLSSFEVNHINITYMGEFGDQYVWRWGQ